MVERKLESAPRAIVSRIFPDMVLAKEPQPSLPPGFLSQYPYPRPRHGLISKPQTKSQMPPQPHTPQQTTYVAKRTQTARGRINQQRWPLQSWQSPRHVESARERMCASRPRSERSVFVPSSTSLASRSEIGRQPSLHHDWATTRHDSGRPISHRMFPASTESHLRWRPSTAQQEPTNKQWGKPDHAQADTMQRGNWKDRWTDLDAPVTKPRWSIGASPPSARRSDSHRVYSTLSEHRDNRASDPVYREPTDDTWVSDQLANCELLKEVADEKILGCTVANNQAATNVLSLFLSQPPDAVVEEEEEELLAVMPPHRPSEERLETAQGRSRASMSSRGSLTECNMSGRVGVVAESNVAETAAEAQLVKETNRVASDKLRIIAGARAAKSIAQLACLHEPQRQANGRLRQRGEWHGHVAKMDRKVWMDLVGEGSSMTAQEFVAFVNQSVRKQSWSQASDFEELSLGCICTSLGLDHHMAPNDPIRFSHFRELLHQSIM